MRTSFLISASLLVATSAAAQTVQLPTFSFTSVGTTVVVPDQGAAFLGGINRASSGQSEFGVPGLAFPPFKSRGIGQDRSASSFWVTATIHDFDAMDEALLNSPSPTGSAAIDRPARRALAGLGPIEPPRAEQPRNPNLDGKWQPAPAAAAPAFDLATEQTHRAEARETRSKEADEYFQRGQDAEERGKPSVAKVYYQMAARRASGELKQQCLARLEAIGGGTKVAQGQ